MPARSRGTILFVLFLIALAVFVPGHGALARNLVSLDGSGSAGTTATVISQTRDAIELSFDTQGFEWIAESGPAGDFARLAIPGEGVAGAPGAPAMPRVGRFIEIPWGARVSVEVVSETHRDVPLASLGVAAPPAPVQPPRRRDLDPSRIPFAFDEAAYRSAAWTPGAPVTATNAGRMRGRELGWVEVQPVAWRASDGMARVYTQLTVRVRFEGGDAAAGAREALRVRSAAYDRQFERMLLNPGGYSMAMSPALGFPALPVHLLIVTAPAYESGLAPLVEWKTMKGYRVTVVTTTVAGSTASQIAAYIANAYSTWPDPPTYVLLVGDTNTIPAFNGTSSTYETDLYFVTVGAGDYFPEMSIGRFPVRTSAQLAAMVEKSVDLEKLELGGGPEGWLNKVCFIAAADLSGFAEYTHQYVIDNYLTPAGITYDKIYERQGGTTAMIRTSVNGGVAVLDYSGHGYETGWSSVPFSSSDVAVLTNANMHPFVISNACMTGRYGLTECFTEAWATAAAKGAVVAWGAANYTYWDEDDILEKRMFDAFFTQHFFAIGGMTDKAKLGVWQYYGGGGMSRYYYEAYNVMGDPSLEIWCGSPKVMTASYPSGIPMGVATLDVQVNGPGGAVDSALCAITSGTTLLGAAYTDDAGHAVVTMDPAPSAPGTLALTITRSGHRPHFGGVQVVPSSGPYVMMQGWTMDDDRRGRSRGDADLRCDMGETLELSCTIRNVGSATAPGVVATLSSDDPYIVVSDSLRTLGDMASGAVVTPAPPFLASVRSDCPDLHVSTLRWTVRSGESSWVSTSSLTLHAPRLCVSGYVVDDTAGGDGDRTAEPGETVSVMLRVRNDGSEIANMVGSTLRTLTPDLTVVSAGSSSPGIAPGAEDLLEPAAVVTVAPGAASCTTAPLQSELAGLMGCHQYTTFGLRVGGFFDDIETSAPGWTHHVVTSGCLDQWHQSVQRDHTLGTGHSWKQGVTGTGTYGNRCDGALVSPVVTLGAGTHLTFWHWMSAEVTSTTGYCYDGGLVEMKLGAGAWQPITPVGGYTHRVQSGSTNPLPGGTYCWSGDFGWAQADFDLGAYSGTAQFRFRFASDSSVGKEGWYVDDVLVLGSGPTGTSVTLTPETAAGARSGEVELLAATPNPFNPKTTIRFHLPREGAATLAVFDVSGRLVATLASGARAAGWHEVSWNGRDARGREAGSGVYFYRLEAEGRVIARRLIMMR